jgi:Spy/CpxP family protein refolding chaperone
MKTRRTALLTAAALMLTLLGSVLVAAQEKTNANSAQERLQELAKKLNLTDDQKQKLRPILQDEAKQMQAVRADTSMTKQQKMEKAKDINESFKPQISAVLTPEQQKKWEEMKEEWKEKHMDNNMNNDNMKKPQ